MIQHPLADPSSVRNLVNASAGEALGSELARRRRKNTASGRRRAAGGAIPATTRLARELTACMGLFIVPKVTIQLQESVLVRNEHGDFSS